jgi:hypothetical protein
MSKVTDRTNSVHKFRPVQGLRQASIWKSLGTLSPSCKAAGNWYFAAHIRLVSELYTHGTSSPICYTSINLRVEGGIQTGSTRHVGHFWPIVPAPGGCEDGEFRGMKIGRGSRNTRRKRAPAPLCPPQIPLDQTRARTRAAVVGSQRLTAWAMARPYFITCLQWS